MTALDFQGPMELLGFLAPNIVLAEESEFKFGVPKYGIQTTYLSASGQVKPVTGPIMMTSTTYDDALAENQHFDMLLVPGGKYTYTYEIE